MKRYKVLFSGLSVIVSADKIIHQYAGPDCFIGVEFKQDTETAAYFSANTFCGYVQVGE